MKRLLLTSLIIGMIITAGGCAPTTNGKDAIKAKWEKATSFAKLPAAQQQYSQGRYADALKTVDECLAADPNCAPARLLSGKIMLALGQKQKAVEEIERAVKINDKLDEGYFLLAQASEDKKDYKKACELYAKASGIDSANVNYILGQVRVLCHADDYADAGVVLDSSMEAIPASVELKFAVAQFYEKQGRFDEAIRMYSQARSLEAEDMQIAESMAYCLVLMNKWGEAAQTLEEIIAKGSEEQKKNLGQLAAMCYMNCGQYGKAIRAYSKLAVTDRGNAQAWLRMGQAALGVNDAQRAYACSQKAIELQADYADAMVLAGCSQYTLGRYTQAIENFHRSAADKKVSAFSWMMIGKCYQKKGMAQNAAAAFEKAKTYAEPELMEYMAKSVVSSQ